MVEVQRVDVLVLLRRVLGVGDGAVGPVGEPLGVLAHPGVVRARPAGPGRARPPCPARGRVPRTRRSPPWCPGRGARRRGRPRPSRSPTATPGSSGPGVEGVVGALAERAADGVDRREVHHVEPHRGDRGQPLRRRSRRCPSAAGPAWRPRTRGKNSYHAPNSARRALDAQRPRSAVGDVVAQRVVGEHGATSRRRGRGQAGLGGRVVSRRASTAAGGRSTLARRPVPSGAPRGPLEQPRRPPPARARRRCPPGTLISARCRQVPTGSSQASTREGPVARGVGRTARLPAVGPVAGGATPAHPASAPSGRRSTTSTPSAS